MSECCTELPVLCADKAPSPVLFRRATMPGQICYPLHAHEWGEFVYSFSGVIQIRVGTERYLILPNCVIWVPPRMEHQCCSGSTASHCSVYIAAAFCERLSKTPCAVEISPLMRSLLLHLGKIPVSDCTEEYIRILRVFLDQLLAAPCTGNYLPTDTDDPQLAKLLRHLVENPDDTSSVSDLAASCGMTERTLSRQCRKELGITFHEWRLRLKIIHALLQLEGGRFR